MQPARCRWSCRGTRRPRKLRSCLDRVAIDPHRSRASIRSCYRAPLTFLTFRPLSPRAATAPHLASPRLVAAPQENGKIEADTGPRRQTTTFSRKRPGSRIRSDDRCLPCKTGWWSFLWNSANRTCVYIYILVFKEDESEVDSLSVWFCRCFVDLGFRLFLSRFWRIWIEAKINTGRETEGFIYLFLLIDYSDKRS